MLPASRDMRGGKMLAVGEAEDAIDVREDGEVR